MDKQRIIYLLERYVDQTISGEELTELSAAVQADAEGAVVPDLLRQLMEQEPAAADFNPEPWQHVLAKVLQVDKQPAHAARRVLLYRMGRLAAAAVLLLVLGSAAFFYFTRDKGQPPAGSGNEPALASQIVPGSDKAILTLGNGQQIVLDSASGNITQEGGVSVINLKGQLNYAAGEGATSAISYHTVSTPRGGQYQLVLADGSKVWLNAASSLRFPTVFAGGERKVAVTGEAYFEVAHNKSQPFVVQKGGMEVRVLGTHFNVSAYEDEPYMKVTLVEGSVRVTHPAHGSPQTLLPGQQAKVGEEGVVLVEHPDVEEAVAWKNGRFVFNVAAIQDIMRQAERWYDVQVAYEGEIRERFSGNLSRQVNITQLLQVLEATDKVRFEIKGKNVLVKSK